MAAAGSVVVNLIANTGQFTRKMKMSQKMLGKFRTGIANFAQSAARMGAIASGVVAAGLSVMVKRQLSVIDTTAKLSDRIGVSTEFLSAYGHAASIAGTSQEEFNKAIEMYVRRLGEAQMGTGEAKDALEALGIPLEDIINQSPEQSFVRIADGIKQLGTQSEKSAVAYKLFGRSGSKMLNLLESDLSGVISEAEQLGISFSRVDAAKIEEANDAVTRLKAAFTGVANEITIKVAPAIETMADAITRMFKGSSYELAAFKVGLLEMVRDLPIMSKKSRAFYQKKIDKQMEIVDKLAQQAVDDFKVKVPKKQQAKADDPFSYMTEGFVGPMQPEAPKTESLRPSAMQIDASLVSVAGLAMNAETKDFYEKQQVALQQEANRYLRKISSQEILN